MARTKTARLIQLVLVILIVAAVVRLLFVMRARRQPAATPRPAAGSTPPLNREAYVVPKKLHLYDLKSARELTQQPVWVKEGYRYTVYPWDPARKRADFNRPAGMLIPIQKLQITDVAAQPTPGASGQRQVLAIFKERDGQFAVPVGTEVNGQYQIYADEMFFYEDPHELYKFWLPEVWKAIDEHRLERGMDVLQTAFAIGMGQPQPASGGDETVFKYPNGGKPLLVTFRGGQVVDIKPANSQ